MRPSTLGSLLRLVNDDLIVPSRPGTTPEKATSPAMATIRPCSLMRGAQALNTTITTTKSARVPERDTDSGTEQASRPTTSQRRNR